MWSVTRTSDRGGEAVIRRYTRASLLCMIDLGCRVGGRGGPKKCGLRKRWLDTIGVNLGGSAVLDSAFNPSEKVSSVAVAENVELLKSGEEDS